MTTGKYKPASYRGETIFFRDANISMGGYTGLGKVVYAYTTSGKENQGVTREAALHAIKRNWDAEVYESDHSKYFSKLYGWR